MLMDLDGLWYETTGLGYAWFVRPIAAHRSVVSDFTSWRGMLVLAGNDAEAPSGGNYMRGGENVGLWFGKTDDLWQFGPPAGEGGPWLDTPVDAGVPSDPYLMTDFERKEVELRHDQPSPVEFRLEVDVTGQARTWLPYATLTIAPGRATVHHFPDGFSAHWIRLTATRPCRATARFVYGGD